MECLDTKVKMLFAPLRNIIVIKICDKIIQNKELISDTKTHWVLEYAFNIEENCYTSVLRIRKFCFLGVFVTWDQTDVMDDITSLSIGAY